MTLVALVASTPARAQGEGPTRAQGPTREARAATVRDHVAETPEAPRLLSRYHAFQRDFDIDFGVVPSRLVDRLDPLLGLQARLEQRWGDTTLYHWLERGIAFYTWFQASTHRESRGFDITVAADDMAEGKLGVQMSRPLGSGTVE